MLEEATTLIGLQIYTNHGVFVGIVNNIIANISNHKVDGLYVEATNPALVEASRSITIPFRWVQNVGDIIVLKHFPDHVELSEKERLELMYEQEQYGEIE
ncbi:PRC-barrel domain-containing protein [bacterium]|nr:PRC-barrel domain-containing protein [bacterium]